MSVDPSDDLPLWDWNTAISDEWPDPRAPWRWPESDPAGPVTITVLDVHGVKWIVPTVPYRPEQLVTITLGPDGTPELRVTTWVDGGRAWPRFWRRRAVPRTIITRLTRMDNA